VFWRVLDKSGVGPGSTGSIVLDITQGAMGYIVYRVPKGTSLQGGGGTVAVCN
jgi:hypothetical protein